MSTKKAIAIQSAPEEFFAIIRVSPIFYLLLAMFLILIAISSCTAPTAAPTPTPPPTSAVNTFPDEFYEIVQVGENRFPLRCLGRGEPTIILENGDQFTPWDENSLKRFSKLGRVCFYRRAGYLEPPSQVRTVKDQVRELHQLLETVGVPGPYILVGFSRAGLHLVLFADEFPDEVAGLVFIECQPPTYFSLMVERLGSEQSDDPDWIKEFRSDLTGGFDFTKLPERTDILASVNQAQEVTSLGDLPVVVLVSGEQLTGEDEWEKMVADSWLESQTALSELSTHSRLEIVPDVSHLTIVYSSPVDKAVEEIYQAAQ